MLLIKGAGYIFRSYMYPAPFVIIPTDRFWPT